MPGSFNVFDVGSATIVVDRPMPSWFLRSLTSSLRESRLRPANSRRRSHA